VGEPIDGSTFVCLSSRNHQPGEVVTKTIGTFHILVVLPGPGGTARTDLQLQERHHLRKLMTAEASISLNGMLLGFL
jgi:hypothetical protein